MPSNSSSTPATAPVTTPPAATPATVSPAATGPVVPASTGNSLIDAAVASVLSARDDVKSILLPPLTATDRKRLVKVRKAAQALVDELITLALARPSLVPLGTDLQKLNDEMILVGQFNTLMTDVTTFHTSVGDTVARMQGDLNKAALDIYAIASRAGVNDPGVAAVVAKMASVLSHGPRQKHVNVKVAVSTVTVPTGTAVPPPTGTLPMAAPAQRKKGGPKQLALASSSVPASAPTAPSGNAGSPTPAASPAGGPGGSTPATPTAGNSAGGGTGGTGTSGK